MMKKLLFSALAVLLTVGAAGAQTPVKYHGEVNLGYSIGVGTFATGRVNIHTIQGIQVDRFKAQIGYNAQCLSDSGVSITMGALQIKAGVTF